jgi:hypothetical protein
MTISATVKAKRTSKRFMLVRLTPGRYISDDLTGSGGAGVYAMTFPYPIARIERGGLLLNPVNSSPATLDDYWYDETTQTLRINLSSAASDHVLIAYYYIFLTGNEPQRTYQTPTDSATTVRDWEPRLTSYPKIRQSFKGGLAGVLSSESSALQIINTDHAFQSYLTDTDSLYNKAVEIWICVDSVDNIQKVYQGGIHSVNISPSTVTIQVIDAIQSLNQTALFGDTIGEATFLRRSDSFPNMRPTDLGVPVPLVFSTFSKYRLNTNVPNRTIGSVSSLASLSGTGTSTAVNNNYSASAGTSLNRGWQLCRLPAVLVAPALPATPSFFDVVSQPQTDCTFVVQYTTADWLALTNPMAPGDHTAVRFTPMNYDTYAICLQVTVGATYTTVDFQTLTTYATLVGNIVGFTGATFTPSAAPSISVIQGTAQFYPVYSRDYTYTQTTTTGGNQALSITFVNNFEANHSTSAGYITSMTALNPNTDTVVYRTRMSPTSLNHSDVLSSLVTAAGLVVDSVSFAAAKSALAVNACFSIPNTGSAEYLTYRDYAEALLKSTLGYISMRASDNAVTYSLLTAPTNGTTIDSNLSLRSPGMSAVVDYQDIITSIYATNPHNDSTSALDATAPSISISTSSRNRYLHGLAKTATYQHVLESLSARVVAILALRSARSTIYRFETAIENIDSSLGDDLTLSHDVLLGGVTSKNVKIISIERDDRSTTIEASDLLGL